MAFFSAAQKQLRAQVSGAILNSERTRAAFLRNLFLVTTAAFVLGLVFSPQVIPVQLSGRNSLFPIIFLLLIAAFEEAIVMGVTRLMAKQRLGFSLGRRLLHVMVEVSLPTVMLYAAVTWFEFSYADMIVSPVVFFYFVFIAMSALYMDFYLPALAGVMAAAQYYLFVTFYILPDLPAGAVPDLLTLPFTYLERGAIMLLAGLVTGAVAYQTRRQMVTAFQATQERAELVNLFGQHVSPAVVDRLLQQGADLGSESRYVCVMFLDIRDYSTFSEKKKPEKVFEYLNTLFSEMIEIVNAHHGTINKFLGDGFMAVFGAPISDGADVENAIQAARELLAAVERLQKEKRIPKTRVGIGLHAGKALTGDIGSNQRKEYTVIGDVVNVASRVEALNKEFDSQLLVTETVWKTVCELGHEGLCMGSTELKGLSKPIKVFKLA